MRAVVGKFGRKPLGRPRLAAVLALTVAATGLAACDASASSSAQPSPSSPPTTTSALPSQLPPQRLTFGVLGTTDEVAAYKQMAALFAPLNRQVRVSVKSWPDASAMIAAFASGEK
ncbi:MAG: hypothetical protein WAV00_11365, partial [Nocardioides sp.]